MSQSKEKREKLLLLICGPATEAIQALMAYYLKQQNKTLQQFIDDNQHDIYHLYRNDRCCMCPAINQTKSKRNRKPSLQKEQIEKLFDTKSNAPRKPNHNSRNSTDICCCFAKSINVDDLDITLLKCFFINLCQDFLWDKFLVIYHSGSFQQFLQDKQHDIFHLCHRKIVCCKCKNGKFKIPHSNLQISDFVKLYDFKKQNCNMIDTCAYCAKPSIVHYNDLKVHEPKVFMELTNCLCPLRLSIDEMGKIRNKLVHGTNTMQEDYDDLWEKLKSCLLEIGTIANSECLTADSLDELWSKPLDMMNIGQKLEEIIENQDVASKILHAKVDNLCTTVADMKDDINPRLQSFEDDIREMKEKIHLSEIFLNQMPLIREMNIFQHIQPLDYDSHCSYPIYPQKDLEGLVSNKDEDAVQQQLLANCQAIGLRFTDLITPWNGNCFFEAVSCQLKQNGLIEKTARQLRRQVVEYLKQHRSFEAQNGMVYLESFLMVPFEEWARKMKQDGEFADHVVIVGTAKMLEYDIFIVTSSPQTNIENCINYIRGKEDFDRVPILLGHFWEVHYQSLEPINELKVKELNGTEENNNTVCVPFKSEGPHDILRQIDHETCNILDAATAIIGEVNLDDYTVTGAKIEFTLERRNVKQRQIQLQENEKDGTPEIRKFDYQNNNDFDILSIWKQLLGKLKYLSIFFWTIEEDTSDSEDDSEDDTFTCRWCGMEFNQLNLFLPHQRTCISKKSKKKKRNVTESGDERGKPEQKTAKLVFTKKPDMPKMWKDIVKKKQKKEKDSFDIDGMTVEFIKDGSLVVWAKLDKSVVKNGTLFVDTMDKFMINLFKKCPIETEKETSISIQVEVIDSTEDDDEEETDTYKCGRCKEMYRSLASFTSHKKKCVRSRQKARKIEKPICKETERLEKEECQRELEKIHTDMSYTISMPDVERRKLRKPQFSLAFPKKTYTVKQLKKQIESTSVSCRSSGTSGYETESGADTELDMIRQNQRLYNKKPYRDVSSCVSSYSDTDESTSYVERQHVHFRTETKQGQKQMYLSKNLKAMSETSGYESGTGKDSEVEQIREESHTQSRESHGYLRKSYTNELNEFPNRSGKLPTKSKKRNARNRRKKRRDSARSSTSETNLDKENDIAINFEWGDEDDYYPYNALDNESDDVYSDENNSDEMQMQSDSGDEEIVDCNFDRVKINYYETSRALGKDERRRSTIDTKMIQYGLALSGKCLANMQQKFRKSSKKYESFYTPFIEDVQSLISMCENYPDRFKRGILKIRSSHNASCRLLESTGGNESVEISGRSKCGKAYSDDDIVVEIHQPTGHTSYIQRMDRRIKVSEQFFGKVIGRIKRNRYEGIDHPVLVCELDKHEYDKAKPVCRTLPKFHLLSENRDDKNPFSVDIYNYDEPAKKITFKKTIQLSPTMRKKFLFYVAYISWTGLYPLGAIIKVHESTKDFLTGLDILELQYKVPTLYTTETVKCVERLIDDDFRQNKLGRFDLTDQSKIKIFTIDPKNARVLDDAVSIEKLPNGEFRVGVHITDVSCFIEYGSELDQEAQDRGTTFFRGNFGDPHQMLPEPISTDRCSLTAGKSRLALSVFYHFDKHLQCIHKNTACIKSIIRSCNQFSYDEVQRVIEDNSESSLKEEIKTLFQISKSLRKKRLGNGMFSVSCENELFETDETLATCPEAYYLIEELMILTNHSVASYLLHKFPECVPLRCQDPPSAQKLKEWRKAYPVMADIILCLQGYPKCMDMKTKIHLGNLETKDGTKLRPNDITFVQKWLWKSVGNRLEQATLKEEENDYEGAALDEKKAALLLRKEELHPFHALAIHEWKSMQGFAEYRCSGIHQNEERRKLRHFNLGIFPYTHFTAPIRRYIDLVVHRLLHAAIDGETVDSIHERFDCEKMHSLCQNVNKSMIRAKDYDRQCRSLLLAFKLRSSPAVVNSFVEECSDKDISLVIPGCNFLPKQCRSLRVNLLGVSERPKFYNDVDKLNSAAKRKFMVLTWKDRIYSKFGNRPFPKYPNRGYQVAMKGNPQKIDPDQKSDITQTSTWIDHIKHYVLSERSQRQMQFASNFERGEALSGSFLHSSLYTENDVNSEIKNQRVQNENDNRIITDQFCNYSMDFHHGQVVAVQLSSEMQKGILTPYIQLMDMTRNLKYCLQHMRDPIGCLEKYSTVSSMHYYDSSEHYKNVWIPILLMETAMKVVRDNNVIINDLPVIFQATGGFFTLKSDYCYERNIDVSPMSFSLRADDDKQYNSVSSDYLCIKCPVSVKDGSFLRINKSTPPHEYKILTNHAKIEKVSKANKNTADEKLKIHFRILGSKTLLPMDRPVCTIEIMQKPEIDKRVEVILHRLNKATKLSKAIALKRDVPTLDEDRIDSISEYDVDIGLPKNNKEQNKAIKISLEETFSLIHGPPGTGKTNMGIKLVCLFNAINRKMESEGEERKQMIYCGPSNKSVDLVAARLLQLTRNRDDMPRIGRLYGSSIENLDYPIPGREYSSKKNIRESKSDSRLTSVSVHHLIRRAGQKFAEEINSRYRELRQMSLDIFGGQSIPTQSQKKSELREGINTDEEENFNAVLEDIHEELNHNDVINKVKAYNQLVQEATIEELKTFDVVFCTTAMATNSKLLKGMNSNIFQVIIDECGMCTEPECISTIIATKAEQVVLIGDHKQLQPVVVCPQARQLGLQTSLFERYHNGGNVVQLTTQYRMHRSICEFPSKKFYNDKLKTDENSKSYVEERPLQVWFSEEKRTVFCHVEGEEEILPVSTEEGNEMSRRNQKEVDQVIKIYRYLHNEERIFERKRKQPELTINIMSQYNDQCAAIRSALKDAGFTGVNVNTVVSSQGGEWDYIIFSLVRSLPDYRIEKCPTLGWCSQNLGFITDKHQINVALTRAKKGLFLIGNKHLLKCDEVWKDLIQTYDRKGCVVNGSMYPSTFRQRKTKKKIVKRKPKDVDEDGFQKV